jgi:hypothetical protein
MDGIKGQESIIKIDDQKEHEITPRQISPRKKSSKKKSPRKSEPQIISINTANNYKTDSKAPKNTGRKMGTLSSRKSAKSTLSEYKNGPLP